MEEKFYKTRMPVKYKHDQQHDVFANQACYSVRFFFALSEVIMVPFKKNFVMGSTVFGRVKSSL